MSNNRPLTWPTSIGRDVDFSIRRVETLAQILSQADSDELQNNEVSFAMGMVMDEIRVIRDALKRGIIEE